MQPSRSALAIALTTWVLGSAWAATALLPQAPGAGAWSPVHSLAALTNPPASPALLAPDSNAVNLPDTVTLICGSVPGADTYVFKLGKIAYQGTVPELVIVDSASGPDTTHKFGPLEKGTTYLWSALASNAGGISVSNVTRAFGTLPDLPAGVTLVFPGQGDTVTGDSLIARWQSPGPTVVRYRLQVAYDSAFSAPIDDSLISDTLNPIVYSAGNGRYWWRVQAWNAAGWGPYGDARWFQVDNSVVGFAGNPRLTPGFGGRGALLRYDLAEASRVTISLFDLQGRERARPMDGFQGAGPHALSLADGQAQGWYLLRFKAEKAGSRRGQGMYRKEIPVFLGL